MLNERQFARLNFGEIDAESDELLVDAFVRTSDFERLLNGPAWLVLGPKGSGKSAIYKYLEGEESFETFVHNLSFRHYPWSVHRTLSTGDTYAYTSSWDYFNLLQLMEFALADQSLQVHMENEVYRVIDSFFKANWRTAKPKPELIPSKTKLTLEPAGAGFRLFNVQTNEIGLQDLVNNLPFFFDETVDLLLSHLNPEHRYWVIFDELDHGFDEGNAGYTDMLIGLLQSVRKFNEKVRKRKAPCKFVVLLRSDIFEVIQFQDHNKMRESNSVNLRWSEAEEGPNSLKVLLEKRIVASLGDIVPETWKEKDVWELVFDENQEMPGHRSKFQFMCDYTRLRPRDAIKYANLALAAARRRGQPPFRITNEDMNAAKKEYSAYFRREVNEETAHHRFPYGEALSLLTAHHKMSFTEEELRATLDAQKGRLTNLVQYDIRDILMNLWDLGIIAQQTPGRGYEFSYEQEGRDFSRTAERFRVHYGLKEALQLVNESSKSPSHEDPDED